MTSAFLEPNDPLITYYTCVENRKESKEHCVKGIQTHIAATLIATHMCPHLPFFLEKMIFEHKFPNHILHPGIIVSPNAVKPKDEIY